MLWIFTNLRFSKHESGFATTSFPIFPFSFLFVNSYLGNSFKKFISHFMLMLRFGLILDNSLVLNPKKSFAKLDFDFFILKLAETNMMSFGLLLFLWWKVLGCFLQDVVYLISVYPVLNSKCHYSIFCSLVTIFEWKFVACCCLKQLKTLLKRTT